MSQFGYPDYKGNLREEISNLTQIAQAEMQKQLGQTNTALRTIEQLRSKRLSREIQHLEQHFEQLRCRLGLSDKALQALRQKREVQIGGPSIALQALGQKGLEVELRLLEERFQSTRSPLELQLPPDLRSDFETLRESILSKLRPNQVSPTAPVQTPNLSQQAIYQSHSQSVQRKSTFRSNATSQKRVLIAIYRHLQNSQEQVIEWKPSAWFGKGTISQSARVGWCNALSKLIEKGLVERRDPDNWKFTHNRGNAEGPISLTPEGYQEAKWLIQND